MKRRKLLKKPIALLLLGLFLCLGCISPVETYAASDGTPTTLDISKGSIIIGADAVSGYDTAGNAVTEVDEDGYIITGTATTANTITVNGGNPTITFNGLNITRTEDVTNSTPVVTVDGDATIKLVGSNTIDSSAIAVNDETKRHTIVLINSGATLTVNGSGSLTMTSPKNYSVVRGAGTFVLESGTVELVIMNATQRGAIDVDTVKLLGGSLNLNAQLGHSQYGQPAIVKNFIISGGVLTASSKSSLGVAVTNFTMTGGTVNSITLREGSNFLTATTATITGGNVNSYYSAAITGRTLTTLTFGTSYANRTVYVSEDGVNYWSARVNADGKIITYLGENTKDVYVKTSATGAASTMKLLALGTDYAGKEVLVSADGTSYWSATTDASGSLLVYLGDAETAFVKLGGANSDPISIGLSNSWTVTVPANLTAGGAAGTVALTGTWAANQTATVAADENITLTCDLDSNDKKTVAVSFDGISQIGGITAARTEAISVAAPTDVIFGEWTGEITYSVEFTSAALSSISATVKSGTVYAVDEEISKDDVIVVATYTNGGTQVVADYTVEPSAAAVNTTSVTVSYAEGGVTKTTTVPVKVITKVEVTQNPTKMTYNYGDEFDKTGMEVTVTYADGTEEVLSGNDLSKLTFTPTTLKPTSGTTQSVLIDYMGVETTLSVTVNPISVSIALPDDFETEYAVGDTVDPGSVTVTYSDGTTKTVTNYTVEPSPVAEDTEEVTITYTDPTTGEDVSITVPVKVITKVEVTQNPTKMTYYYGGEFDKTGMEVTVTYADGTEEVLSGNDLSKLSITPATLQPTTGTTQDVTISYKGVETTLPVTVNPIPVSIALPDDFETEYAVGDTVNPGSVTVTYSDGTTKTVTNYTVEPSPVAEDTEEVTITYTDPTTGENVSITVPVKVITKVEVTQNPTKMTYNYGNEFDKTGMEVTVTYADGTTAGLSGNDLSKLSITNTTLEPASGTTQSVLIDYMGVETTLSVTVNPIPVSIAPPTYYTQRHHAVGETVSTTAVISVLFSNGTKESSYSYTVAPTVFEENTASVTITYTHEGTGTVLTKDVPVYVVTGITVTTPPNKTTYASGETFAPDGMKFELTFASGEKGMFYYTAIKEDLTVTPTTLTAPASGSDVVVTLEYLGKKTTYTVTVES